MKKITFQEILKRFQDKNITEVILCENEYNGWKKKSKFYDLIVEDYFWAIPETVFRLNIVHPKRRNKKRKNTCLEKYGVDSVSKDKNIKNKIKQTNLKKYGHECSLKNKEVQNKIKKTNLEKYGNECVLKTDSIKQQIKQTNLERYGVENPSQNDLIKYKKIETLKKNYNVDNPSKSIKINEKKKNTCLKKYGVINPYQIFNIKQKAVESISDRFILETNQHLRSWLLEQPNPKPGYTSLVTYFNNKIISLKDLEEYFKNYKENKTKLEVFTENLFNISHYNKTPKKFINSKIKKYRPDFKLSDKNYLNVDGLYWHSEEYKDKHYHYNMRKEFEESNLRIFQFYENEIYIKNNIIKSIVDNSLNKTKDKIYARKCVIKTVTQKEADIFLSNNHLMGTIKAKHIGLYNNDNLCCLLSYKEKKNVCKIERFCSVINTNIIGGFSRLLNHLEKNLLKSTTNEIHNWVDLRYGTGKHLLEKDFKFIKETLGWKWTDGYQTYNRLSCRANMDNRKLSEKDYAEELNLFKIYDAGQRLYIKSLNLCS